MPLDYFVKICHNSDDFMGNLCDLSDLLNIDIIKSSYFLFEKRNDKRLKICIGRNDNVVSDNLIVNIMIECLQANF